MALFFFNLSKGEQMEMQRTRKPSPVEAAIVVLGLTFMVRASSDVYDLLKGKVKKAIEETRND